ncbi:uncharacterized protein FFB20_02376 [Fusarium fujikuroi]|uniref:Altered inheritance of mitochondria protein 11 n=2 Tax=Fusarium fujikuroi TaxID=5127 RepID=S0E919_GIBF5|nr:uncharacterized protein FFUJ_06232 [Fusarium fujikuroi IMI 58289]KLO81990.1 uncharacterized protein Y057_13174 [Fusarium fujikuroi]KLO83987.1 uncharacterized protein LW93_774 [Fusarium fujikuroi]KLP21930.1 uncharacterized protein LW94_1827 [Fusarium fujikuroi]QGI66137.1 hypothetical protein CEK27_010108 [Fusarium fujikuroi]QGI83379.1 hypothetical protein CEK25_010108 [Fusarium fujikuroi]
MPILASLVSSWLGIPNSDKGPILQENQETSPAQQRPSANVSIPPATPTPPTISAAPQRTSPIIAAQQPSWDRSIRQFGLLLTGAGFLAASVAVSRRSVLRMRHDSFPKFYTSNRHQVKFDSGDRSLLAVTALGLATLNVMSFGVMLVGGISWAFDLSSIEELRQRTQAVTRRPGMVSPEDEKAMEELIEGLMGKMGMEKPQKPSGISQEDEK